VSDRAETALDSLLRHRVIAVLGKGGVGRTSVSAAFAAYAARKGMRTLVMESDPHTPVAASYGAKANYVPVELAPNLWSMHLGGRESLEEYLSLVVPRPILRAVFMSSLYQYFVDAAPAVRELTMMGKIFHDIERRLASEPQWNLIVFDAPASGQALSMIRMPFAARETFGESIVGRQADNVAGFLRNQAMCAMVEVTTAEPLAIAETLELHRELGKLGLVTAAVVFNRMSPASFDSVDIARLVRRGARDANLRHLGELAEIARGELKRRARERRALGILQRQIGSPLIKLQERRGLEEERCGLEEDRCGLAGRTLVEALIAQLSAPDSEQDGQGATGPPVN